MPLAAALAASPAVTTTLGAPLSAGVGAAGCLRGSALAGLPCCRVAAFAAVAQHGITTDPAVGGWVGVAASVRPARSSGPPRQSTRRSAERAVPRGAVLERWPRSWPAVPMAIDDGRHHRGVWMVVGEPPIARAGFGVAIGGASSRIREPSRSGRLDSKCRWGPLLQMPVLPQVPIWSPRW